MKLFLAQVNAEPLAHASVSMKTMLGWACVFGVVAVFAWVVSWLGKPKPRRRRTGNGWLESVFSRLL